MTEKFKTLSEIRDELADQALEKEVYEKGHGFLEKPYSRYRFHNGFSDGFDSGVSEMKKRAQGLVKALESVRAFEPHTFMECSSADLMFASILTALEAYRKSVEGE